MVLHDHSIALYLGEIVYKFRLEKILPKRFGNSTQTHANLGSPLGSHIFWELPSKKLHHLSDVVFAFMSNKLDYI